MKFKSLKSRALTLIVPSALLMFLPFVVMFFTVVFIHPIARFGGGESAVFVTVMFAMILGIPAIVLTLFFTLIYAFLMYPRRIIDKVNAFADAAASGDFAQRIEITEIDEFGVMEERLNAMIAGLDDMRERQAELVKSSESANRSKSDFLSRMSHEIRSPMNAIIGMTQIAKASADNPDKVGDCLIKIDAASKHLLNLINDVLDMSKIEANKFELMLDEFSLERVLHKVYDMMNVRAEEKKQKMTLAIDKDIPAFIISDELRLSQVITNLVSNAVKFTEEGGNIDIDVRQICEEDGVHTIKFSVKDNGIGLARDNIGKLFTPFEQGDGSVSRKFGGTGLGLAISKRIVEMMGGEITVESKVGEGSTFSFTARVRKGAVLDAIEGKEGKSRYARAKLACDMRILVADDSEDAREYMAHTLSTLGFTCELARDGDEAVNMAAKAAFENRPYTIIYMDYMMPKLDGIEASKRIMDIMNDSVSIVMVSMYDWKEFEHKAREAGVAKCVSKPVSPSTMLDSMSEIASCVIKNGDDTVVTLPRASASGVYSILLVDDIEINREIVCEFLSATKVNIDMAVNGRDAVEKFRANPDRYDVILMDIQMPEMDGFEATRHIRETKSKKAATVPVIAMTANALSEDVRKCREAGMNDHIAKPVDPEELIMKLNDYFFMKSYLGKNIWQ